MPARSTLNQTKFLPFNCDKRPDWLELGNLSALGSLLKQFRSDDTLTKILIGIDLGARKTEAIALESTGNETARLRVDVAWLWSELVFSDSVSTRFVKANLGDYSGVRGAAWLWPSNSNIK